MRLTVALLAVSAFAASKSPITHETMWLMKRVTSPVVSPDGKWVVFNVTEPAYSEKDQSADLWIVPAAGGEKPRRLTFTKGAESGVCWSDDSRKIAFAAKREGDDQPQVYVLDVAGGGEAVRATNLSTGASSPRFSPDGKSLMVISNVFPNAADDDANKKIEAERKARKYNARVYESFPIRYWDRWLDDKKAHILVQPLEGGGKTRDLLAGSRLAAEPGFAGVSGETGEDLQAVWAPDGRSIVFAATTKKNASAYAKAPAQLYQIAKNGGEPLQLTSGEDSYQRPKFRPDGKALYALFERHNDKVYNLDRLAMFAWPSPSERTVVTASLDRSVDSYAFSPDSASLYLLAEEAGHEKIFLLPASGGEARLAYDMSLGVYTGLSVAERARDLVMVANWESSVNPSEVVRIEPSASRHRPLTSFNQETTAGIDWQAARHFWFTAKNGKRIHNMLVLPPAFDASKKYPLLVLMHGGPHSMWRDQFFLRWNYHLLASPGYVVLLTNYTGSTGFGERFAQEIQGDPLKGPGDEINEAADEAIQQFAFIDGSRQGAAGASYGGHLANWMQATTTRYKCLASHAGLINLESQWGTSDTIYHREMNSGGPPWEQGRIWREQNPIRLAKNFHTPILLTVGERDFRVPMNETIENWSVLQRLRIPSKLIVFPEANHWIMKGEDSRFFYQELQGWLKKYLQ